MTRGSSEVAIVG